MCHRVQIRKEKKYGKVNGLYVERKKNAAFLQKQVPGKYLTKWKSEKHCHGWSNKKMLFITNWCKIAISIFNKV